MSARSVPSTRRPFTKIAPLDRNSRASRFDDVGSVSVSYNRTAGAGHRRARARLLDGLPDAMLTANDVEREWPQTATLALAGAAVLCLGVLVWWVLPPSGIHRAAWRGDVQRIRALASRGADLDEATFKLGDGFERRMTPVMWAVDGNRPDAIRVLAELGASVRSTSLGRHSPVYWAIFWRRTEVLDALLDAGAGTEVRDRQGQTALLMALENRDLDAALCLLEHGADPTAADDHGNTPRVLAAPFRGTEFDAIVEALVAAGADANAPVDRKGRTFLMVATRDQRSGLVRVLLDAGADPAIADRDGATAIDCAERVEPEDRRRALLEMLRRDAPGS